MLKIASALLLAGCLAACNPIGAMTEGIKNAKAVETDLEQLTGSRPQIGFNVHNGQLTSVSVIFPTIDGAKPLRELAGMTRTEIAKHFKQTPSNIVLGFAVSPLEPGTTAALQPVPYLDSASR